MATLKAWLRPDESVRDAFRWRSMHFFSTIGMVLGVLLLPMSWKVIVVYLAILTIAFALNYLFYLALTSIFPSAKKESLLWFLPAVVILVALCAVIIFAFSTYRHGAYWALATTGGIAIDLALIRHSHKRLKPA